MNTQIDLSKPTKLLHKGCGHKVILQSTRLWLLDLNIDKENVSGSSYPTEKEIKLV